MRVQFSIDELRQLPAAALVEIALDVEDRQWFWLILGMICSKMPPYEGERVNELWATAYVKPDADYHKACELLREWKEYQRLHALWRGIVK